MSFYTMSKSITGEIPATTLSLVQNKVAEALGKVYDEYDWSFQTMYAGWLAPGLLANSGTFTVTPYQNTIIADATATAVLLTLIGNPLLTTLQYRDPARAIYSIVGYDDGQTAGQGNFPFATLTLDRPWMEPTSGPGQPYMIYQAYFVSPVQDFRKFIEMRDTTNARALDFTSYSQADLANCDPQRTDFSDPKYVVPCGVDLRAGSATYGYPMFELWPQQLSRVPYSYSMKRRGPALVKPTDTVPYPLTEELVMHRAKELLYFFKEAQKGENVDRGSGANWLLLAQSSRAEYKDVLEKIQAIDINLHNEAISHVNSGFGSNGDAYANRLGQLNIGGFRG
jgi:hypothetical protein